MKMLPDAVGLTREEVPVTDLAALNGALPHYQAQVVFNCAAYNAVDAAEGEQDAAYQVNAQGAFNVALACAEHQARLVHFSTNFVFSGAHDRAYVESDEVGPLGVYAKSKLEGEKLVAMVAPRALIIRTAALFGGDATRSRLSFPERIVERAASGERVRVVSDQTVNPTYAADLARAAIALATTDMDGVVHVFGGAATAQRLPGVDANAADAAVARGATRMGCQEASGGTEKSLKKARAGRFLVPAPSLAAGGEVLCN